MGFRIPRPETAFSLDKPSKRRDRQDKEPDHLAYIRKLPCVICGDRKHVEAAHLRYASPAHGKMATAMGQKPADRWSTPLCVEHHRAGPSAQHNHNEAEWWQRRGIDPCALAMALYAISGDVEAGEAIISATRNRRKATP